MKIVLGRFFILVLMSASLHVHAQDVKALLASGKAAAARSHYDSALIIFQQAFAKDARNFDVDCELSAAYRTKKDYPNAELYARKAIEINASAEGGWNMLALTARDQHNWNVAIEAFRKVVAINPKANISLANMGYCYEQLGKSSEAIDAYSRAIEVNRIINVIPPAYLFNNRGFNYARLKKYNEALADYKKALELEPGNKMAENNLANLQKEMQAVPATGQTIAQVYKEANDAWARNDYDAAIAGFTKTIAMEPKAVMAYYNRAKIYDETKKDLVRAIEDYKKSVELQKDFADGWLSLGFAYYSLHRYSESIAAYTQLIALTEKASDDYKAAIYFARGAAYNDNGDFTNAIADYNRSISISPNSVAGYEGLALAYLRQGEYDESIVTFDKSISMDAKSATAYSNRGLAYFYKGNIKLAMQDYNRAISLNPNLSAAYNNRAAAYDLLNNAEQEIADYKKAVALDPGNLAAKKNLEIAMSVLGDGKPGIASYLKYITGAIAASRKMFVNNVGNTSGSNSCERLLDSYLLITLAEKRLNSLKNAIALGAVTVSEASIKDLPQFEGDLKIVKQTVEEKGRQQGCGLNRVM